MRALPVLAGLALLTACRPAPPTESGLEGRPDKTAKGLAACASGDHRGAECEAARSADARRKADGRMQAYRKGF